MTRPVLILYSSDACGACSKFIANSWDKVKKDSAPYVTKNVHKSQKNMSQSSWDPDMPSCFKDKVSFFPTIFLARSSDWEASQHDKDIMVTFVAFPARERTDLSKWIEETATQPNLTSTALTGKSSKSTTPVQPVKRKAPTIANSTSQGSVCSAAYTLRGRK